MTGGRLAARGARLVSRGRDAARGLAELALSLVVPPRCALCAGAVAAGAAPLCGRCLASLPPAGPPVCPVCRAPGDGELACADTAHAWLRAAAAIRAGEDALRLVHLLKYGGADRLAPALASVLAERLPRGWVDRTAVVVPVPLHRSRLKERGFNQSALLAVALARLLCLPVRDDLLLRSRRTRPQAQLDRADRAGNVRRAFAVPAGAVLPRSGAVLLVDDVLTSGATARAAAEALREAGAAEVLVATVLRV